MESGGNMQSNEEKSVEKSMDNYLKSIGLHRKKIAKDGSCLFRAVAEQVLHNQSLHTEVRAKCVEFLRKNRDSYEAFIEGDFEEYLFKLRDPQQWVGEVEINALAVMYKRDFLIFQEPDKPAVNITDNNFKDKVQLCFLNGNHYDSVYPISHVRNTAICQSILYELLYDGVFQVDRSSLSLCQRSSRPSDLLSDDSMPACGSSDESDLDSNEPLWLENGTSSTSSRHNNQSYRGRGRGRLLPERVRRSLNPTLLRNVEYDVWHKSKRAQQKLDYCIAAGMQFTVGDRCQVRLENNGRSYNAVIREVPLDNGLATVYIEELGKKLVPLWSLRPPNNENSWSTVVNRDKRLSNGHGEWEERGKGRGRGKSVPASSSVSQATATGSSGRVQKQHSWPQQATVEEQGGGKNDRKSVSTAEAAFGITVESRKAKEEEEMNMALVEIQLRDEHSFPALGTQSLMQAEGVRRKGGEKRRSLRNKTKSPVEEVGASSPSTGERPKSFTPPPGTTPASSAPSSNATTPTHPAPPTPPAASAHSDSARLNSQKTSTPNVNMAAAASGSASNLPPASAAPAAKANPQSYASATAVPASPPPVSAPSAKPVPSSASHFSFITPVLPAASSPPASSSSPSMPAASPLTASSVPPPTFIAPIAPSPTAPKGLPRSFSPVSSLPHSPSPPPSSSHTSYAAAQVIETQHNYLPKPEGSLSASQHFQNQTSLPQIHPQAPAPPNQNPVPASQAEKEALPSLPETQNQASLPQNQVMMPQMSAQVQPSEPQTHLHFQSEVAQNPPGAAHPHIQPPHPSQVPHPSLSLPPSTPVPSHESFNTQNQTEALAPPPRPPSQQSQPLQPSHLQPPHLPSLAGAVPLQQLSQIYQDPLYPGFPQGEKGEMAPIPAFSSSQLGDDLPQDLNVLRFFFNLGVKAYATPMFPPYLYLLPLQQTYTMHPKPHSPSPHYPPSDPPTRQQEAYLPPQYTHTPAPAPPQYDHQPPLPEPPCPSEPSFTQTGFQPPPHRMPCTSVPWQQIPSHRNPSYQVAYSSPSPPYPGHPPSSQGYHPGQGPVHTLYSSAAPQYPTCPAGYQSSSTPEELQASQGAMEQLKPPNGDAMLGHGHIRVMGPLEGPAVVNVPNANNNRPIMVPPTFGMKKELGEGMTRTVLLVDPPLNNKPILAVVSDADIKDTPVSMATMRPGGSPGSPTPYRGHRKQHNNSKPYVEPGHLGYLPSVAMAEPMSVACSTEDDYEDSEGFRHSAMNHMGQRRSYKRGGGRGRGGGYDGGRGAPRRRHGDVGAGSNFVQYSSYRGQGREKRY